VENKELLEMAAKAAGVDLSPKLGTEYLESIGFYRGNADGTQLYWKWNPLSDDGDALRLAIKCEITDLKLAAGALILAEPDMHGKDLSVLIRRAIVRAAVEIGKSK
jgi:hypothetical protein